MDTAVALTERNQQLRQLQGYAHHTWGVVWCGDVWCGGGGGVWCDAFEC